MGGIITWEIVENNFFSNIRHRSRNLAVVGTVQGVPRTREAEDDAHPARWQVITTTILVAAGVEGKIIVVSSRGVLVVKVPVMTRVLPLTSPGPCVGQKGRGS